MARPEFFPDLSTITSVLLADGWHQIKPGTFEVNERGESARFLVLPPSFAKEWIVCGFSSVLAVAIPAGEDD